MTVHEGTKRGQVAAFGLLGAISLGTVAGTTLALSDTATPNVQARTEIAALGGSYESHVDLTVEVVSSKRSSLQLDISVTNKFEKQAAFQIAYMLVTADGNVVNNVVKPTAFKAAPNASKTLEVDTGDLADGLYALRVTAGGSDGDSDATTESETYIQVTGGSAHPIEPSEWFTQPAVARANEGENHEDNQ
jgi:hypothetical protein